MIEEIHVLRRIQHLEQGRCRVALVRGADLVDLVQHDDRIGYIHFLHCLDKFSRHSADIGTPMPLDLGLIAHATHGEAIKFASQGLGDGMTDGRLADARRADQQDDGTGDLALHGADRDKLQYPVLDVVEPGVIPIQYRTRMFQVQHIFRIHAPRQQREPIQIVARDRIFRRAGFQHRQLLHFVIDTPLGRRRQAEHLEAFTEGVDLSGTVVLGDTELLLDRLELLAQKELTLIGVDFFFHLLAQMHLGLGDLDFFLQHHQHLFQPCEQMGGLQHLL